ncbi:hypothetical protein Esti_005464 [Eimeria stiedai]
MALPLGLHVGCSFLFTAALLLAALVAAWLNHWSLPPPSPLQAPPHDFSESRAQLLLQLATRSVRTLGSCDNEVAMPALLLRFIGEQLLLLRAPTQDRAGLALDGPLPAAADTRGAEQQAVVGRVSYVLLAQHRPRDTAAAAAAAAAAEAATRLRRVHPPGQVTELETCLCGVQQEQRLLRKQQQHHAVAAAAAAATGLHAVLLQETERELPPLCTGEEQRAACAAAVLRAANEEDLFSPSAAAALHAAYKVRTRAAAGAAADKASELSCLEEGPLLLDPGLPRFLPGTLTPRMQCFKLVRHFLAPPTTLSVLLGLLLQQQQQQQQGRQAAAAAAGEKLQEGLEGSDEQREEAEAKRLLLQRLTSLPARERGSLQAAAAAAAAAAEAAGEPLLQHLSRFLLAVDVGLWGGAVGGFSLDYRGTHTALYARPRNLTVHIHSTGSSHLLFGSSPQPNADSHQAMQQHAPASPPRSSSRSSKSSTSDGRRRKPGLLLAAHYDSAPSSPGISDDLGMCAVGLEVARAAVYRHLQAADALQLRELSSADGELPQEEAGLLLPAPLLLNLNGAEEAMLLAAHAFAAHHPLARDVKLAINLEAAGSRGKAYVLQAIVFIVKAKRVSLEKPKTLRRLFGSRWGDEVAAAGGSTNGCLPSRDSSSSSMRACMPAAYLWGLQMPRPWARQLVASLSSLPSPNASAAAADVWNSGLFPGETDFRVWAEVLGLKGGLDLAWIGEGANYHTKRDTLRNMQPGSLQHLGSSLLHLLQPLLRIAAAGDEEAATAGDAAAAGTRAAAAAEVPFYQDVLGRWLLLIPWEAFPPLLLLLLLLLLLSWHLQQHVLLLGASTSLVVACLSCLTFGLSCLAAAAAGCCTSLLGALLPQLQGPLYVHWPLAAAGRVTVAFAVLVWCWHNTFFSSWAPSLSLQPSVVCSSSSLCVPSGSVPASPLSTKLSG